MRIPFSFPGRNKGGKGRFRHPQLVLHLIAALVLVVSFTAAFFLFFPEQALRDRLVRLIRQQGGGGEVKIDQLILTPLGLRATGIVWHPGGSGQPPVTIGTARLSPLWLSLLSANPGIAIEATLPAGSLNGEAKKDGSMQATFSGIAFRPLVPAAFPFPPEGTVSGSIVSSGPLFAEKSHAAFELAIDQAAVAGLDAIGVGNGRLALGRVKAKGEVQGRTLKIEELRNSEGEVQLQGRATLQLSAPPSQSRINAQFDLTPGPGFDPMLRELLSLTGIPSDKKGNFRFRVSGTLANPVLR